MPEEKVVYTNTGFVQAMNGHELWINTVTDEMVKFVVKDRPL